MDFSKPIKTAKWVIPHIKTIDAPRVIAAIILKKFLLKMFFERYAIKKEAIIMPYKNPNVGEKT